MDDLLNNYAALYEASVDRKINGGDEQRAVYNPVIFLFVGDKISDSINSIKNEIDVKWNNSNGVLYFHIYRAAPVEDSSLFRMGIPLESSDLHKYRKSLYRGFYDNESLLIEFNQKIRQAKARLQQYGRMYSSFEKVNLCVITRVDDPLNVLIPEITLLFKSKLYDDFKMVSADLYGLIAESNENDDFGYASAISVAFFKEIEYFQGREYSFKAPLEVLNEGVRLDITNGNAPVFDLIYLLGDKNEDGIIPPKAMERNYRAISYICLLKNKIISPAGNEPDNEQYNNEYFKKSISAGGKGQVYASAGISWVKRPNSAIALAVLYHYYRHYMDRLKENTNKNLQDTLRILRLDEASLDMKTGEVIPEDGIQDGMMAIMSLNVSPSALEGMTFQEAEVKIYGDSCMRYFNENFEKASFKRLEDIKLEGEINAHIEKNIVNSHEYGLYCGYMWTSKDIVSEALSDVYKDIQKKIDRLQAELKDVYSQRVVLSPVHKLFFYKKQGLMDIKRKLIEDVYIRKREIASLMIKQRIVLKYEAAIEKIHREIEKKIYELESLESLIVDASRKNIAAADSYLGQNINEYYGKIVDDVVEDLSNKWGSKFYFDERFAGYPESAEMLLKRLIENSKKYILDSPKFMEPFEEELLHRANISSEYGEKVLSEEELFKNLYSILERDARVSTYIMEYSAKHRHEEKYFFGDYYSLFIQYGFKIDQKTRTYRLGCVHEKRTSGIEKLNLMGGFTIESLVYARNSAKYYNTYEKEGFELHGIDKELLPDVEFNI
ncbi:hypothetical protein OXPF_27510 [Oxobacter pfennigii]|uniref:Uncharacterized protein n=1 Tax=Oxobacter pfennigii TaxID=36849 RepID=A0A0P8YUD4_9CLOT|nr:hypothetical protein [Oxobacter pfennigii]KPU43310.1 hypothetical protein OXPF_27510 [Oxobacter pfennigii]